MLESVKEKIKAIPQGVKASAAFFVASIVSKGIAYITTPLYTRLLTPDEYGQVSVFLTWMQIFGIVAMFCLSYGVFNNGMLDYPDRRNEYSFSMLILSNIITVCFFCLLLPIYPHIKKWIGVKLPLILLMGAIFLLQPAYSFWTARQRYELKYKTTVIWSLIGAFLSPIAAITSILLLGGDRVYARIFGAESVMIVIYIGFYIYVASKSGWKVDTRYWKPALAFNLPLIPHYLSTYLLGSSDKIMISRLVNDSATARYSVAYSVASVGTIIWSAVNSSLIPYTYEKCKKKEYFAISDITMLILTVFAAACIFVIMLAPEVVVIMATEDYREAIYVIPPIVGGVFFQIHYYIYANVVYYFKKPKYVMFASAVATFLNLVLNYIFIEIFGYIAAGYTTLFCYLVQACMDYFALKKVLKKQIYNMRYLGILSLGVGVTSLLSNFIYGYAFFRYAIVGIIALLGVVYRKKIVDALLLMKSRN